MVSSIFPYSMHYTKANNTSFSFLPFYVILYDVFIPSKKLKINRKKPRPFAHKTLHFFSSPTHSSSSPKYVFPTRTAAQANDHGLSSTGHQPSSHPGPHSLHGEHPKPSPNTPVSTNPNTCFVHESRQTEREKCACVERSIASELQGGTSR